MPYCSSCGKLLSDEAKFCPNCGTPIQLAMTPTPVQVSTVTERPSGITILAALEIIEGIIGSIIGIAILFSFDILRELLPVPSTYLPLVQAVLTVVGSLVIFIALVNFVIAYGLLNGTSWAWTVSLVFAVIGILRGIGTLPMGILTIGIQVLIIYYLTRENVKSYFEKS